MTAMTTTNPIEYDLELTDVSGVDYKARNAHLITLLRQRDTDPAYANAPVLDTYSRLSRLVALKGTPEAIREREKIDRQDFDCLTYLVRMHARLGLTLRDPGRSAWKKDGRRPGFVTLLARLDGGLTQGVVAWHLDRLMRQPWDLEQLIHYAEDRRRRYTVATCYGEYDITSEDGAFKARIEVAVAKRESDAKSRRLRNMASLRREHGEGDGDMDVFGHSYRCDRFPVTVEELEREQDAIRWGVDEVLSGGSWCSVAREWNRRGLTTRQGHRWTPAKVSMSLCKPRHAGLLSFDGKVVHTSRKGASVIIERAQYDALMALCAGRQTGKRGRPKDSTTGQYVLTSIARCGQCGTGMHGETDTHRTYNVIPGWESWTGQAMRAYRCPVHGCNHNATDARALEEFVRSAVVDKLSDPRNASAVARKSAALAKVDAKIATAEAKIAEARHRLGTVEGFTFEDFDGITGPLKAQVAKDAKEREALIAKGAGRVATVADRAEVERMWACGDVAVRRTMVLAALPFGVDVHKADRSRRTIGQAVWIRYALRDVAPDKPIRV